MNPGQFKHRIKIFTENETEDDDGFRAKNPVNVCEVWCAIKTIRGTEYFASATTQKENFYRFIIRYRSGIDSRMKIDYKGRIFEIESVLNDDELQKTLTIIAKERV